MLVSAMNIIIIQKKGFYRRAYWYMVDAKRQKLGMIKD